MAETRKQRRRRQWSAHMCVWFGDNPTSRQLDTNNRHVERRKRRQFRRKEKPHA